MIVRTQFPDLFLATMLPALDELIFAKFDRFPPQYTQFFRVMSSGRSIEQTSELAGLGTFGSVAEGANVRYDEAVPGFNKTYTHTQFGLGFKISRVMIDDDKFGIISKLAQDLGKSASETCELDAVSDYNNGFSNAFPGPDGLSLFNVAHPLVKSGGTQTNQIAVAADLDIPSIEVALTDFRRMKDPSGKKIRVKPEMLIVPPESAFAAAEIMTATMRADTANHTPNAFRVDTGMGTFSKLKVWDYLSNPDAWFIQCAPEDTEIRWYNREKFNTVHDVDFDSRSVKTAGWMRYSHGWSSFYGVYGSPGA